MFGFLAPDYLGFRRCCNGISSPWFRQNVHKADNREKNATAEPNAYRRRRENAENILKNEYDTNRATVSNASNISVYFGLALSRSRSIKAHAIGRGVWLLGVSYSVRVMGNNKKRLFIHSMGFFAPLSLLHALYRPRLAVFQWFFRSFGGFHSISKANTFAQSNGASNKKIAFFFSGAALFVVKIAAVIDRTISPHAMHQFHSIVRLSAYLLCSCILFQYFPCDRSTQQMCLFVLFSPFFLARSNCFNKFTHSTHAVNKMLFISICMRKNFGQYYIRTSNYSEKKKTTWQTQPFQWEPISSDRALRFFQQRFHTFQTNCRFRSRRILVNKYLQEIFQVVFHQLLLLMILGDKLNTHATACFHRR